MIWRSFASTVPLSGAVKVTRWFVVSIAVSASSAAVETEAATAGS